MLGHMASTKKASSKFFEESDSRMTRPRAVSELSQRPSPRLKGAPGSEASGGVPRRPVGGVRGTAPRSPLHEKRPVGTDAPAGAGAGSRVAELEAKLDKAHGQLTEMREQLTAAEKARKEARSALVEAKKRFAAKKRDDVVVAASTVDGGGHNKVLVDAAKSADVEEGANDDKGGMISSSTDVLDAVVPSEPENNDEEAKNTTGKEQVSNAIPNGDEKIMWNQEAGELRAKLKAQDMEVYELRAKLMVRDTEADELRETLTAKTAELDELRGKLASNETALNKLTAKDAEIAALEADNADLTKVAEEANEAAKAAEAWAREAEHALRESAAREARVAELLRASERAREAMETEAQRSRVQREQWRKAAEEAAVVLGCVDPPTPGAPSATGTPRSASAGSVWTAKGADDDGAGGRRKSGAVMRVFSGLWKKKAQK